MSEPQACRAHGDQEEALGPLRLELQIVVSYSIGIRNQIGVLCKSNWCS